MQIILKQDVDELGFEGDVVDVARGYARNFLIPKGFALEATPQNLKAFEQRRRKIELKRLKAQEQAEHFKEEVQGTEITFRHKAGEEGKLYGSVTAMDIAAALEAKGIVVDRRKVLLEKPIKTLGEHQVEIKIYPKVIAAVSVKVEPEQTPAS